MTEVSAFTLGDLATNCYLIKDKETGEMAVVDPATDDIIDILKEIKCDFEKIKYIVLTHGHFDHIYGVKSLKELTGAQVVASTAESSVLADNFINLSFSFLPGVGMEPIKADVLVDDGNVIKLGKSSVSVMMTPGHTKGSMCLVFEDNLVSGDTLFCESVGRTDLPTGNMTELLVSLKKIKALEGNYRIYPGHGRPTTLDHEKKYNFYME